MRSHTAVRVAVRPVLLGCLLQIAAGVLPSRATEPLPILPARARAEGWGALALGEMVFRYFGLPAARGAAEYQCGIAAVLMPPRDARDCLADCLRCERGSGLPVDVKTILEQYPKRLERQDPKVEVQIVVTTQPVALTPWALRSQLLKNRPIVALLGAQHGVPQSLLIVGYRDIDDDLILLVNDPLARDAAFWSTVDATAGPHAGSWWVSYDHLREPLDWDHTLMISASADGELPIGSGTPRSALDPVAAPVAVASAQGCCVQSAYGPARCPIVGGPYTAGNHCSCQIGSMGLLLSGQICD